MRRGLVLVASLLALILSAERLDAKSELQREGRIIFIIGESGGIGPSPNLVMMNADGSNSHLRLHWASHASFSPNGRSIAYELISTRDTRVIAADGPMRDRLLIRNGSFADWSPAGIAFERGGDVWVRNPRTGAQTRVVSNGDFPELSRDGKRLAFVRKSDVWVADLPTKRATSARRVAKGGSPAWSPDGRELAFSDEKRIVRIRPDGTHRRVVWGDAQGYCGCRFLDWAR